MKNAKHITSMLSKEFIAWTLFCLGFFFSVWDMTPRVEVGGFTIKIQQIIFAMLFLSIFLAWPKAFLIHTFKKLRNPFFVCILLLSTYYLVSLPLSYFPLKGALYSCWILFNLGTVWLSLQFITANAASIQNKIPLLVLVTLAFNTLVVLIDHIAHGFGYIGGLIGYNQDILLKWGVSRPHAFSGEPSYISAFMASGFIFLLPYIFEQKKYKPLFLSVIALCLLAIFVTTSRTGIFAAIIGGAMYFLLAALVQKLKIWKPLAISALSIVGIFALYTATLDQKQRDSAYKNLVSVMLKVNTGSSGHARVRAHYSAYLMAKETHWLGTGLGASYKYWVHREKRENLTASDQEALSLQMTGESVKESKLPETKYGDEAIMSIWGQLLAEGGLPALLLYATAAFFLLRALWRSWRTTQDPLVLGALCSCATFFFFTAFWLGNVARGDTWVWYAVWSAYAFHPLGRSDDSAVHTV